MPVLQILPGVISDFEKVLGLEKIAKLTDLNLSWSHEQNCTQTRCEMAEGPHIKLWGTKDPGKGLPWVGLLHQVKDAELNLNFRELINYQLILH